MEEIATATTVHNRFQVVDEVCGLVQCEMRRSTAFAEAQRHLEQHHREGDFKTPVHIFDLMARLGAPQTWNHEGVPVEWRQ